MGRPKKQAQSHVIKASAAIQIHGKITLLQRRAWNVLLANAYDALPHTARHRMPVVHLMQRLAFDSKNDELPQGIAAGTGPVPGGMEPAGQRGRPGVGGGSLTG